MKWKFALLGLLLAGPTLADSWNSGGSQPGPSSGGATWEQKPAGTDSPGLIDDYIRDLKWEVRRRGEVELHFGPNSGDNGLLREGAARAFVDTATGNVDNLNDGDDGTTVTPGFYNAGAETNTSAALTTIPSGWTKALGIGRMLFDSDGPATQETDPTSTTDDDYKLYVHTGSAWVEAKAQHDDISELSRQKSGAGNQILCGSFECMDAAASGPPTSYGWTALNTPTTSSAQLATGANDEGLMYRIVGNDAVNKEGIQYTLSGLRPSTTYAVVARGFATAAGDVCTLRVTGGTTSPVDSSTSSNNVWESLHLNVTTDGTPTNLVVQLGAGPTAGTDQCDFDRVAIYEESLFNYPNMQPVLKYVRNTTDDATLENITYVSYGSLAVRVPTDGYAISVTGHLCALANSGLQDVGINGRITQDNGGGATSVVEGSVQSTSSTGSGPSTTSYMMAPLQYVNLNPTSGTTYTYSLEAKELSGAGEVTMNAGSVCDSSLKVEMIPQK